MVTAVVVVNASTIKDVMLATTTTTQTYTIIREHTPIQGAGVGVTIMVNKIITRPHANSTTDYSAIIAIC